MRVSHKKASISEKCPLKTRLPYILYVTRQARVPVLYAFSTNSGSISQRNSIIASISLSIQFFFASSPSSSSSFTITFLGRPLFLGIMGGAQIARSSLSSCSCSNMTLKISCLPNLVSPPHFSRK